jgi:hypothetical protein
VFLEFWKRRRAVIAYDWDLIDWEEEEVCIIYFSIFFKKQIISNLSSLIEKKKSKLPRNALLESSPMYERKILSEKF